MERTLAGEPRYGWLVVAAGALMTCIAFGAVFALAVFLQPMTEATGWSRAGISGAMTLVFLAMGLGGFVWGTLSDRFGARPVVLAASVLLALGLALASRADSLLRDGLPASAARIARGDPACVAAFRLSVQTRYSNPSAWEAR